MLKNARMAAIHQTGKALPVLYDRWLLISVVGLLAIGLLMVTSSSIVMSYRLYEMPFHYLIRQSLHLLLAIILGFCIARIRVSFWSRMSGVIILGSLLLLILVLVPGLGREVNGATRWLGVSGLGLQVSEIAKFAMILYLSAFMVRHGNAIRSQIFILVQPVLVLILMITLMILQPDFGASAIIVGVVLGLLFLAGVRLSVFITMGVIAASLLALLAITSPYRLARLTSFLNPWEYAFESGYQLTQSLIAFGRGGWFGTGLGESVQKLFYLPEAHTDFIFAVIVEELGFVGAVVVILLYALFVYRTMRIGYMAEYLSSRFAAYVAYGIGLWIGFQALVNIAVSQGALPTKGLTLPLISYGGSSLLITGLAIAVLFRIDYETRLLAYGFTPPRR